MSGSGKIPVTRLVLFHNDSLFTYYSMYTASSTKLNNSGRFFRTDGRRCTTYLVHVVAAVCVEGTRHLSVQRHASASLWCSQVERS